MTTQTNTTPGGLSPRLDIASRIVTGILADGYEFSNVRFPSDTDAQQVADAGLKYADALLAANDEDEAESRAAEQGLEENWGEVMADIARVTRERDNLSTCLASTQEALQQAEDKLEDALGGIAEVTKECDALRAQLAAALAPLPEEEGLKPLSEDDAKFALDNRYEPGIDDLMRHALASHARCKASKAQQEGGAK